MLLRCSSISSLHVLSAMLFMIVYLLLILSFYWSDLECIFLFCISFLYTLLSFCMLAFVGFLLLHKNTVFMLSHFFLTSSISNGTLFGSWFGWYEFCCCFYVGIDKVLYYSFEVFVLDISWRVSNLFLTINVYLLPITLLVSKDQLYLMDLTVPILFLCTLRNIFAVTILWSEDTPSGVEYASQFRVLFIPLFCNTIYKQNTREMDKWMYLPLP